MTLGQGQKMTLTFNTHISSLSQLVSGHKLQKFWKINSFHFFLYISLYYQIWPCHKIGQGQPRIIIWTNYDGQESLLRHTKFVEISPPVPEKKIFEGFLPYMGMAAILVMWPPSCQ